MTRHFPIVLMGNALSLMVAATKLAKTGADVAIVNSGKNWGGHFTTVTCKGVAFDAGMVLHEFTSYNAQSGAEDPRTYDAAVECCLQPAACAYQEGAIEPHLGCRI